MQGLDWSLNIPEVFKDDSHNENDETKETQTFLAASSRDKTVTIWSLKDASKLAELKIPPGPRGGNKSGENPLIKMKLNVSLIIGTEIHH